MPNIITFIQKESDLEYLVMAEWSSYVVFSRLKRASYTPFVLEASLLKKCRAYILFSSSYH